MYITERSGVGMGAGTSLTYDLGAQQSPLVLAGQFWQAEWSSSGCVFLLGWLGSSPCEGKCCNQSLTFVFGGEKSLEIFKIKVVFFSKYIFFLIV